MIVRLLEKWFACQKNSIFELPEELAQELIDRKIAEKIPQIETTSYKGGKESTLKPKAELRCQDYT